jgi:hypothetical protein
MPSMIFTKLLSKLRKINTQLVRKCPAVAFEKHEGDVSTIRRTDPVAELDNRVTRTARFMPRGIQQDHDGALAPLLLICSIDTREGG